MTDESTGLSSPQASLSLSASASAPGKLILFGEHAVVYGFPAIAACLSDLRIKVDVHTRNETNSLIIDLPDLKPEPLLIEIPSPSLKVDHIIDRIRKGDEDSNTNHCGGNMVLDLKSTLAKIGPPNKKDIEAIHHVLKNVSTSVTLTETHKSAIVPIVYLINVLILSQPSFQSGLSISAKSHNLPLGAGLGSSAAFSVAASAALYKSALHISQGQSCDETSEQASKKLKVEHCNEDTKQPSKEQLDVINTLAFYSETLIHGTPSGIDNTVSTYGGALQYTKTKYNVGADTKEKKIGQSGKTVFLENFPPLNVILTNTNVPRSTKLLVRGVKELKEEHPEIVNPILDSIGNISSSFLTCISDESLKDKPSKKQMEKISRLIQINHSLLCALGVSHSSLNEITNLTLSLYDEFKCSTKLTGAGGGGCAFTFLENDNEEHAQSVQRRCQIVKQKIDSLNHGECNTTSDQNENTREGGNLLSFQSFTSAVGGKGVLWL